jgi:hypothetical protein
MTFLHDSEGEDAATRSAAVAASVDEILGALSERR